MSGSIWLIARTVERDGYNGWYDETTIEEERGYFTSEQAAQDYINEIVEPQQVEYERQMSIYDHKKRQWEQKRDELKKVGGRPTEEYPSQPDRENIVDPLHPVEVKPAKEIAS